MICIHQGASLVCSLPNSPANLLAMCRKVGAKQRLSVDTLPISREAAVNVRGLASAAELLAHTVQRAYSLGE